MIRSMDCSIRVADRQIVRVAAARVPEGFAALYTSDNPVLVARDEAAEIINALAQAFHFPLRLCGDVVVTGVDWSQETVAS